MSSFVAHLPHSISVHRVPQMQGGGCAVVLPVLQAPANTADVVSCERLRAAGQIPVKALKGSQPENHDLKACIILAGFFLVSILLVLPFRDIYGFETRSALFVRGMLENGHLLVPCIYGRPYTDYPPLFFLLQYLLSLPAGHVSAVSAALPSALSGTCMIVLAWWTARRHSGSMTAIASAACLACLPEFWLKSEKATIDMLLALECSVAMVLFYEADLCGKLCSARYLRLAGYAAVLTAGLTKGPVGLMLPIFSWFLYLAACRRIKKIFQRLPEWITVCLAGAGAEALLFYMAGGKELVLHAVSSQFLSRLGNTANKPFYYYAYYLALSFLPVAAWIGSLIFLKAKKQGITAYNQRKTLPIENRRFFHFLLCWAAGMLLPFLLSSSRHGRYILPIFLPLSILAGITVQNLTGNLDRGLLQKLPAFTGWLTAGASACILMAMLFSPLTPHAPVSVFLALATLAVLAMTFFYKWRIAPGLKSICLSAIFLIYATSSVALITEPAVSAKESAKRLVNCTEKALQPGEKVILFKIKPDKNGLKYALFSKAYPDRLLFVHTREIRDIPLPFILVGKEKDIPALLPHATPFRITPLCRRMIHGKTYRSVGISQSSF